MRNLAIIGFAVGTVLAGCAPTSGARSEPTTGAAAAPAHDHGNGDQAGMTAGMCPMQVPGTTVAASEVEGGIGLSFTTTTGDVAELRQRVLRMADMHNQRGGHTMMGGHGAPAPGAAAEHQGGAHANRREDFVVGIGYDDSINEAQEIARKVLEDHPAVLNDPEPSVLADGLGRATINLRVYFWLNGREHSWLKVRSSVIRLVKLAFQQRGISMPDEAREVIFPQGIPVTMFDGRPGGTHDVGPVERLPAQPPRDEPDVASTQAEGGLSSEAGVIKEQARQVQPLNDGENLLRVPSGAPPADEQAKNHGDDGNELGK